MEPTATLAERITAEPEKRGGRPCVCGMRIRVGDVLDPLSHGMTAPAIIAQLPALELADVWACLVWASQQANRAPRGVAWRCRAAPRRGRAVAGRPFWRYGKAHT